MGSIDISMSSLHQAVLVAQAETQQRETSHKEERALLEAALEERVAALDALNQTAADAETARAELQSRADELQVCQCCKIATPRYSNAEIDYQAHSRYRGL